MVKNLKTAQIEIEHVIKTGGYGNHALSPLLKDLTGSQVPRTSGFAELSFIPMNPAHLPYTVAVKPLIKERLKQSWYDDQIIIMPTLEKSGSTFFEILLRLFLEAHSNPNSSYFPNFECRGHSTYGGSDKSVLLSFLSLPEGGVLRGSYAPTNHNLTIFKAINSQVVVLLRHPIDRVIASICMHYEFFSDDGKLSLDEVLEYCILGKWDTFSKFWYSGAHPSLFESLSWISGWLLRAEQVDTIFVRYEDILLNYDETAPELYNALFNKPPAQKLLNNCKDFLQRTNKGGDLQASGKVPSHAYPRGYTGSHGIWKNYLTPNLVEVCNTITRNFLSMTPNADKVLKLYPDLILNESDLT